MASRLPTAASAKVRVGPRARGELCGGNCMCVCRGVREEVCGQGGLPVRSVCPNNRPVCADRWVQTPARRPLCADPCAQTGVCTPVCCRPVGADPWVQAALGCKCLLMAVKRPPDCSDAVRIAELCESGSWPADIFRRIKAFIPRGCLTSLTGRDGLLTGDENRCMHKL
ncbi:PREDICTED: keratin, high-sulfur matrix protein, IIIA3-like [Chaetura pelagica]|uniref:keratin, high-sulfur matrix protein, IIIA3-like n=1 Tax=Chaetura pelagica TaxID=8897 RepID=UPI0005235233|nr:PREDICTED: keratin, high-sulfur matrix protein, IIIA3-like [Chaetura pelagica]